MSAVSTHLVSLLPPETLERHTQGPHRLRLLPHDGTESPEALARLRPAAHGSMTLADGQTPMRIITTHSDEKERTRGHIFTTAPMITFRDPKIVFEGTHPPELTRPKKQRPPANYVPTDTLHRHLRGWSFMGQPVCSLRGDVRVAQSNLQRYLMRYTTPPETCSFAYLCTWPLDERTTATLEPSNWANDVSSNHDSRLALLTTVVTTAWLQTWATIMGRFMLQQDGQCRQTWPILLRYYELRPKLMKTATTWQTVYLRSPEVDAAFPTFVALNTRPHPQRTVPVSAAQLKQHQQEWLAFMTTHSFSDVLFAWFYMNINNIRLFQVCDKMKRKVHQYWMTRHWMVHDTEDRSHKAPGTYTPYVVIQSKPSPKVRLRSHKHVSPYELLCISHPVVRPGMPLFASPMAPLETLLEAETTQAYGAKAQVEALSIVWDIALCMTVDQQRGFFRVLFTANGGGLFSQLLGMVTRDPHADGLAGGATSPTTSATNKTVGVMRNTALARVIGLTMSNRGPRDEGRVAQLRSTEFDALEHVSDNKPQAYRWHISSQPIASRVGLGHRSEELTKVALPSGAVIWRNSQSFFAPNHEVDTGRFLHYLESRLTSETYRHTLQMIIHRGQMVPCAFRHPQRRIDLGLAYFSVCVNHSDEKDTLSEYDTWAALFAFTVSGSAGRLPATREQLCARFPTFWVAFGRHWHRYLRRVGVEVIRYLEALFHATEDLDARHAMYSQWAQLEYYASQHRLARFAAGDTESRELYRLLSAFLPPSTPSRTTLLWLLFFYLTHVIQPVPLDPAYFVTPLETKKQVPPPKKSVSLTAAIPVDPVLQLQRAVAHALLFGDVLWTAEVQTAWKHYTASATAPHSGNLIRTLYSFDLVSHSALHMTLSHYAVAHTMAVFAKVEAQLPQGQVDLKQIDEVTLARWLCDINSPDYTVFLQTESRIEAQACEDIYTHTFGQKEFQFVATPPGASIAQLQCPGDTSTEWQRITPNWATRCMPAPLPVVCTVMDFD